MIKTTIIFDYGTEEFAVTVYDQHVDPHAMLVRHRPMSAKLSDYTNLSAHRIEVRHEGQPDDDDFKLDAELDNELDQLAFIGVSDPPVFRTPDRALTKAEIDEWVYGHGGWTE